MTPQTTGALWTKHRRLATGIASTFRIPGQEPEDTRQDALVALWEAARAYDPQKGPFGAFATLVVKRRLTDRLKAETRMKRRHLRAPLEDAVASEPYGQEQLRLIVETLPSLTALERKAVTAQLDGSYSSKDRSAENALQSARRKLRAA